ncbi:MAG: hypothetical protein RJA63_2201 [Pseudomonadota bacterium]|jgi:hypothetical protein
MFRAIYLMWLRLEAEAIRAEREAYEQAGAVGPEYLKNSLLQELECRRRAMQLECAQ